MPPRKEVPAKWSASVSRATLSTDAARRRFGDSSMAKPAIQTLSSPQERVVRSRAASRTRGWRQLVRGVVRTHHDSLPFTPVPLTVQNFGVLLVGPAAGQPARICGAGALSGRRRDGHAGVQSRGPGRNRAVARPHWRISAGLPAGCVDGGIRHGAWTQEFRSRRDGRPSRRGCTFHRRSDLARRSDAFGGASVPLGPLLVSVCRSN